MESPSKTKFATPLPQPPRSNILEWRFPKPHHNLVLTGRSRAAWHTSFIIPSLNLLLDAGLCVNKLRPKHIFITHGHSDHTFVAPAFVKREDPPDIYVPEEMARVFDDFILASTMLDLGGLIGTEDALEHGLVVDDDQEVLQRSAQSGRTPSATAFLSTHLTHGVRPGQIIPLRRAPNITATAFSCHHSVPCLGYVFSQTTHRLKPEYASLSGAEIQSLRRSTCTGKRPGGGDNIQHLTSPHSTPIFAFLGDTTAETLASDPPWLVGGIPVVITECSFLYDEHKTLADKTKHTAWRDLEPVVRRWPKTMFVLIHFSMRYSDAQIAAFFRDMHNAPANIVVWADGAS